MAVSKNQRALVVVNSLSKHATGVWEFIYNAIETAGVTVSQSVLGDDYRSVRIRKGSNATKAKFLAALKAAATTPGIKAVDVFMQLHGSNNTFHFYDGQVPASTLRDDILALNLPDRLRLFYNTGCYGDSQNNAEMRSAGFATTIGAKKINTTGGVEFPTFCSLWQFGGKVRDIVAVADNPATRAAQDAAAKAVSPTFADANSQKVIRGNKNLTIATAA